MVNVDNLRRLRPVILSLAEQYGARKVRIFGSLVRGEEKQTSDVDVLVDFEPGRSLLDQSGFELALEDLLGCDVDVVVEGGISPHIEPYILQEALPL